MLFALMYRILLFLAIFSFIASSCKDEFNDPNPDYEEIIDDSPATIEFIEPTDGDTLRMIDTVNIKIKYSDDYALDVMSLNLSPTNVQGDAMSFAFNSADSVYTLDTFYILPQADTVQLGMITTCRDYVGNVSSKSISFSVIK